MTNQQDYKMEQRTDDETNAISHYQYKRNSSNEVVMVNSVYSTLYFSCRDHQKLFSVSTFIRRKNDSTFRSSFPN